MRVFLLAVLGLTLFSTAAFAQLDLTIVEPSRGQWTFFDGDPPVVYHDTIFCDPDAFHFSWSTSSDDPGIEYRHSWDISDIGDDDQWGPWGTETSAPPRTFFFGTHNFAVQVRDSLGSMVTGMINIVVVFPNGPVLTLSEQTRGLWMFLGPLEAPVMLLDPLTDPPTPWDFSWSTEDCINLSREYRYGWDIVDPNDDSQWTPWGNATSAPALSFSFGTHSFMVEARDEFGTTRGTVIFQITTGPVPIEESTWGRIKSVYKE